MEGPLKVVTCPYNSIKQYCWGCEISKQDITLIPRTAGARPACAVCSVHYNDSLPAHYGRFEVRLSINK